MGEFHYIHHQPGGAPYADLGELSARIAAAAGQKGIGLTHLPVLYTYGGAGKAPLQAGQARFGNDVDRFWRPGSAGVTRWQGCPAIAASALRPVD
ncbi:hypothetical protein ACEWPM_014100 [Roseovarius sp. S4756]|uniref:hypothetical protein n=1 Tax=Roseovarius maritimus TaxID=3342637 RepID=UPI0037291585